MSRRSARAAGEAAVDDYGPMTDLIFSLFAISILLVAIMGSDGVVKRHSFETALNAARRDADALRGQLADVEQRDAAVSPPVPAPESVPTPPPATSTQGPIPEIAALRSALAAREAEIESLREKTERADGQIASLRQMPFKRLEFPAIHPFSPKGFLPGGTLDPRLVAEILSILDERQKEIERIDGNRIDIEIDAPLSLDGGQSPFREGYDFSADIARQLTAALQMSPLPFNCVAVMPFGMARASILSVLAGGAEPRTVPGIVDRLPRSGPARDAILSVVESAKADDSRVTIIAQSIATSPCEPARLSQAIRDWKRIGVRP